MRISSVDQITSAVWRSTKGVVVIVTVVVCAAWAAVTAVVVVLVFVGIAYAKIHKPVDFLDNQIAHYDEAIRLAPESAELYGDRGFAYYGKRDYDRAVADYSEAIRVGPENARMIFWAYNNRGLAYADNRDYARAIADYDEAIKLQPLFSAVARKNRDRALAAILTSPK
jgi:tetratricopeptide (TPR) repeat protein